MSASERYTFLLDEIERVRDEFQKLYLVKQEGLTENVLEAERNIYSYMDDQEIGYQPRAEIVDALQSFDIMEAYELFEEELEVEE